jgi:hypothetical protein
MVWIRVEKNRIEREKKEKNHQSQTLAKMRHPGTYLSLSMSDPTSSESGKGDPRLTGANPRVDRLRLST